MRFQILLAPLATLALLAACAVHPPAPLQSTAAWQCPAPGTWISPATGRPVQDPVPLATRRAVVLLGEHHDSAPDHRWELATIATLYAAHPDLVLGFEMFPRRVQPALDGWVAGRLTEPAFLQQSDWHRVWGFDPELYLPIFRFARDHRIPMLALNVSGDLVHRVAHAGWQATPVEAREGVGTPAPPSDAYRAELADVMSGHGGPAMTPDRVAHFVDAQLLWDRAMAERIATQRMQAPGRQVVAIMGAGHIEHRSGVPHQLAALGLADSAVLLTENQADCDRPDPDVADAVFIAPAEPKRDAAPHPAAR